MPPATSDSETPVALATCPRCGLAQTLPDVPEGMRACCRRCRTTLGRPRRDANARVVAIATAALILYPLAVSLPLISVAKFGHHNEASILEGIATHFTRANLLVGLVVVLCSVVFPLAKLAAMLVLSAGASWMRHHHRALTYQLVELTGRWGMLDVLLVALLVAVLKLGDFVEVSAGPGALAFGTCVVLSLLASASFDPHSLWESEGGES